MNLKKYLQNQAENNAESLLTESDKQFCSQLAQDVQVDGQRSAYKKPKAKFWAGLCTAIAAALAVVIAVPIAVLKPVNEILYQEENIVSIISTIEELNANSNEFSIEQTENSSFRTELYYDSITNDYLYFVLNGTTLISNIKLYIVINENYKLNFKLKDNLSTEKLSDYDINYNSEITNNFMDIETKYSGYIQLNTEIVYIDYKQLIDLGDQSEQAFFNDIQAVLKAKN